MMPAPDAPGAAGDEGDASGQVAVSQCVHAVPLPQVSRTAMLRLPSKCLVCERKLIHGCLLRRSATTASAVVTMDFPPVNALPVQGWFDLADALARPAATRRPTCVVLRAEGRGFNAGRRHQGDAAHRRASTP